MRQDFAAYLYEKMLKNPDIWVLTGDLGYGMWDKIRDSFPNRFVNCGAAEYAMMNIAVGLALEEKIPIVYSITPFLLYRPFEVLRTYIDHEEIPVIMIGSGRDDDYKHDGFSHYAGDDKHFMKQFKYIDSHWPKNSHHLHELMDFYIDDEDVPVYINLRR